jgi:hypothetical protein
MRLISAATIIAIVFCFTATTGANAQYFSSSRLGKVEAIKVGVEADVDDGCLDNPNVLKIEAEQVLRQSGIKVVEDNSGIFLTIEVIAHAITGGCSAHIGLQTYGFEALTDSTFGLVTAADQGGVRWGPKESFPQQLLVVVNQFVSQLANEILKAR